MITMDKKYRTRAGRPGRVLCTDRNHPIWPVVALITGIDGEETPYSYTKQGLLKAGNPIHHALDLIEIKPKRKVFKSLKQLMEEYPDWFFDNAGSFCFNDDNYRIISKDLRLFTGSISKPAEYYWPEILHTEIEE